jgi:hypothetical protein
VARLPESFNFPNTQDLTLEELVNVLNRMYIDIAEAVNSKPDLYQRDTDGQVDDTFLAQGSININLATDKVEILTNHTSPTTVTWVTIS